jgi:hypothetical protein
VDAENLAARFLERFGEVRETLKVGVGVDTYKVNLLDTIKYNCKINNRQFASYQNWIVKECDPGQDTLTIEGK